MKKNKINSETMYRMSFSTGGLFLSESIVLTTLYHKYNNWEAVQEMTIAENLLQARTISSLKRTCREIISRLHLLSDVELNFLARGSRDEKNNILWIGVCRRYRFIAEFAVEVIRERFISLRRDLPYEEFDFFFNRKAEWNVELDRITLSTRNKLRQVLFRILRESDLLTAENMIQTAMLSSRLVDLMYKTNPKELLYFPIFESDVKRF